MTRKPPASIICRRCRVSKEPAEFRRDAGNVTGIKQPCRDCDAAACRARRAKHVEKADAKLKASVARLESDFETLRPEDFDVSVGNDGRIDPRAAAEKRQDYSTKMGEFANGLRKAGAAAAHGGDILADLPADLGTYTGRTAEQEYRFGNRRLARSISLAEAHELLALRRFKQAASEYLSGKITPTGYARKKPGGPSKRSVVLLLSDLHLGSDLSSMDEPLPFRAVEEARRLEFVLRQALDFKPQYRNVSELVLLINGDIIEGFLEHDLRSGAPLTEQKVIFWRYFREFIGYCAQQYPSVRVVCQPGNHGRDKVRHPGRATARKWDGHEWEMYYALSQMASNLVNVTWQLDFRAVSIIDLHGSTLGLTHGDTEVKLADPDTKAKENAAALDRINTTRVYGVEFDAWAFGHFHKPRYQPRTPRVVYNGALVPPNGYARGAGYIGEDCGQFLWEAVEGHPVGDLRFIKVGPAQDTDEKLGTLIKPFRFSDDA